MNIRVAAAVLKQALSLMQSMPTKTEIPALPNLEEYKVSVAKYFSPSSELKELPKERRLGARIKVGDHVKSKVWRDVKGNYPWLEVKGIYFAEWMGEPIREIEVTDGIQTNRVFEDTLIDFEESEKFATQQEPQTKRAPKMTLIQKVRIPEKVVPVEPVHEHIASTGIGCVQCSRDHISTVTAVLNEAMRFAREGGIEHPEVQRRIELAIDELNVMERIDAAPDALLKLPPKEKAIMDEFLPKARRIRQRLGEVKSVAELEQIAADSHAIRMELRVKKSGLSEQMISKVKSLAQEVNEGKITKEEAISRLRDMQNE